MRRALSLLVALVVLSLTRSASAWLLYEHDQIAGAAFARLSEEDRATLRRAWQTALATRGARAAHYCKQIDDGLSAQTIQGEQEWCAGFPALTGLAGDHACVPSEMTQSVEESDWVGPLLAESWMRESMVSSIHVKNVLERTRHWRDHNLNVQGIDPGLVPRAQNNRSHFPSPLDVNGEGIAPDMASYLKRSLAPDAPISSVAFYLHYHLFALREALEGRAWPALVAESFAIHFLQDTFSSGHIVGTWGDLGQRLGSHDYYCIHGLDVRTWSGVLYTAHGDAFLTAPDVHMSGIAAATSLAQVARALRIKEGALADEAFVRSIEHAVKEMPELTDKLTGCDLGLKPPRGLVAVASEPFASDVLTRFPIPASRENGMPRFRSEVGGFLGIMLEGNGYAVFGAPHSLPASDARLRVGVGGGFALEGAFTRFMDGRFFVDAFVAVSLHEYEVGRRAVGFGARVRMPFVAIPGDAIFFVAPVAIANSRLGYDLGRMAASGGLFGLERQIVLRENVSAQLMIGRELAATWFPEVGWQFDLPLIELRGDRLFTGAFAAESVLQAGTTLSFRNEDHAFGFFLSFAERIRRYMPQSCQDGC